jgi:hypothetical protein
MIDLCPLISPRTHGSARGGEADDLSASPCSNLDFPTNEVKKMREGEIFLFYNTKKKYWI